MRLGFIFTSFLMLLSLLTPQATWAYGVQEVFMTSDGLQDLMLRQLDEARESEQVQMRQMHQEFAEFLPRAQQLLLIRDQLTPILESYIREAPQDAYYARLIIDLINKTFPPGKRSGDQGFLHVFFELSRYGFQVEGIDPERLAINTGADIRFNVVGLAKLKHLSLANSVQLWLHEISHFDKETSLDSRDKWIANVTQWVQNRTTEITITPHRRILSLILPPKEGTPEVIESRRTKHSYAGSPEDVHIEDIQKSFLILEQDQKGTRIFEDAYKGFLTFGNFIKMGAPNWQNIGYSALNVNWQNVRVQSIKALPNKKIQIDYTQSSHLYGRDAMNQQRYNRGSAYGNASIMPTFPDNSYRVELDTENLELDIKRNYSRPLQEGDFEIYHIEDNKTDRYVSLRLKLTDAAKKLKAAGSLHLIGKDLQNAELLSFELNKMRFLSKDEVLLHVKVPNRNFEISQLRMPEVSKHGRYSEKSLLPSRPVSLLASDAFERAKLEKSEIQSFDLQEKQYDEDRVRARIALKTNKKVVGITLDLEHTLLAYQKNINSLPRGSGNQDLSYIGEGRKYFIKAQDLQLKNSTLSFSIPEADINQFQKGPTITNNITSFYTQHTQSSAQTLADTQNRSIKGLWIHFSDGSVEKMAEQKYKKFSLRFDSANVAVRTCSDLFSSRSIYSATSDYTDSFF